mgnify:CR=1 FL=1
MCSSSTGRAGAWQTAGGSLEHAVSGGPAHCGGHQQSGGKRHAQGRCPACRHRRERRGGELPQRGYHRGAHRHRRCGCTAGRDHARHATAVCQSHAMRVLIPVNHCENYIVGVPEQPISDLVAAAVQKVKALCAGEGAEKGLLKMPSACALGIFSGKIFYNRATADSLRAVRCCIFTERVQEGNLICLCLLPAETAAQPGNRPLLHCARSSEKASRKIPQDFRLTSKKYKFLE